LSGRPSLQDLLEVQQAFGLPSPALVEKDWHVVKALAAIAAVDTSPFRLKSLAEHLRLQTQA
jgi:hypothetical protein